MGKIQEKIFLPPRKAPTGEQIRAARLRAGLTQEQCAAIIGVTVTILCRWERSSIATNRTKSIDLLWRLVEENAE